jgi:hypothetical protein
LGPYFTFEQLASTDIHPAILNYISAEIDFLIFEDRQNLLKNSVFDYSGEKIFSYFNLISEEVKKSKRFALEYVSKLILHASSFTVNYLVRPKWTLSKFVFDAGDHKTTLEIKQIINYAYYYQYLKKILVSYINSKKIISMNSGEFSELLDRVDKLGIETYLPSILSNAVKSMSDFFNIGEIQKNKVPYAAVEKFLEEKKLDAHLNRIHSLFGEDNSGKIIIADLQKCLDSVMIEKYEHETNHENEIEEIREVIHPVQQAESLSQEDKSTSEVYEAQTTPEEHADEMMDEQGRIKSTKLRIRIDKNNEIEPVEDSDSSESVGESEGIEEAEELKQKEELNIPEEILYESDIDDEKILNDKHYNNAELVEDGSLEKESSQIEARDSIKSDLHPDNVYEQILNEEKESEESMLKTILQSSQSKSEYAADKSEEELNEELSKQKMDVAELLEHKEMTKIIEAIFDYDIEEFANTLDEISVCQSLDDAYVVLNQSLRNRNINSNSKEAESFKSIISQYFNKK